MSEKISLDSSVRENLNVTIFAIYLIGAEYRS